MDVREKLIEILKTKYDHFCDQCGINKDSKYTENLASYLIANGVTVQENVKMSDELLKQLKNAPITTWKEEPSIETVQEWISVKDRLPEPWEQVLIYSRHDFCESAFYIGVPGKWCSTWNHEMLDTDSVTYWMSMPQPPKGE